MIIDIGTVVTMKYQLFSVDPEAPHKEVLIEERSPDDPLEFLFGEQVVVKKVESALKGQSTGFRGTLSIGPEDAFGPYRDDLRAMMNREKFPKDEELRLGMKFQTQGPEGQVLSVVVRDIQDNEILVDGNHPLAGLGLKFELEILRVREATPEERTQKKVLKVLH